MARFTASQSKRARVKRRSLAQFFTFSLFGLQRRVAVQTQLILDRRRRPFRRMMQADTDFAPLELQIIDTVCGSLVSECAVSACLDFSLAQHAKRSGWSTCRTAPTCQGRCALAGCHYIFSRSQIHGTATMDRVLRTRPHGQRYQSRFTGVTASYSLNPPAPT